LFYRLNVISIPCLPLKDRVEDIPLLAGHFLKKYNKLHGKQVGRIDEEVLNLFSQYSWPGNVRELENIIEREVAMSSENTITVEGLNSRIELNNSCENISNSSEYEAIVKALEQNGGHREKTAESLGISRRTLQYRLKAYGLK
jgi:two-component system NtrC family response regulator